MKTMVSGQALGGASPYHGYARRAQIPTAYARTEQENQLLPPYTPSEDSWPDDELPPLPIEHKRYLSPSLMHETPAKRLRTYVPGSDLRAFLRSRENVGHISVDQHYSRDANSLMKHQYTQQSSTRPSHSGVGFEGRHLRRDFEDRYTKADYISNPQRVFGDIGSTQIQGDKFRYSRAQTLEPDRRYSTRQIEDSPTYPYRLQENINLPEYTGHSLEHNSRLAFPEYQIGGVEPERFIESRNCRRFNSVAPELYIGPLPSKNLMQVPRNVPIQRRMLSSPIWATGRDEIRDNRLIIQNAGNHVEEPIQWMPPNTQQSDSIHYPQTPISSSKVVNSPNENGHTADTISEDGSSPALETFLRQASRETQKVVRTPYDIRQVLPGGSIFSKHRRLSRPTPVQTPRPVLRIPPTSEVIDLLSPQAESQIGSPPAPIRSVPMKDRITPARQLSDVRTPVKKADLNSQSKPKLERVPKVESKLQDETSAEIERQKRLAELILEREDKVKTEALQLEIFGEIIPEDDEVSKKREEKERAENQWKRDEVEAEKLKKQEAKRLAQLEKVRQNEVAAKKAKIEKQEQEARNKLRRDEERKRREAAEALEREKLRQMAEEKIHAERQRIAAEAEERERDRQKATAVQAEQEALAKLKARQEEAKKQAASLSIAKTGFTDQASVFASRKLPNAANDSDDINTANPLFVSNDPLDKPK